MSDTPISLNDNEPRFELGDNMRQWLRTLPTDRVVWTFAGLSAGIGAYFGWPMLQDLWGFVLDALISTGPFILASVMIAAYVKATGADKLIARALSGRQEAAVLTAAVFGALSPFCSCGVVPLIAALLAAGVPLAPVMAFWRASPTIDPEMLVLTWGVLGGEMAIAKTLAAIGIGLLGGATVMVIQRFGGLQDVLRPGISGGCGTSSCGAPKIDTSKPVWAFWNEGPRRVAYANEMGTMGWFLMKWLSLAFLLEAMMVTWVPMEQVAGGLSEMGSWAIPASAAVGVPAYLNGYAAIPLVRGLMDIGLEPGAALAFMVAGGVTSIPAAMAVKALVKMPTFFLYLAVAAVGSIGTGFAFQLYMGA